LKTGTEIASALKVLYPKNSIESVHMPPQKVKRYSQKWGVIDHKADSAGYTKKLFLTGESKSKVPNEIQLFSGSAYVVVTRQFLNWIMKNDIPQNLIHWSKDTFSPDEMIWATLSRVKEAPGYRPIHHRWDMNEMESVARAVKWIEFSQQQNPPYPKCQGYNRHGICVFGIGDLEWLLDQSHLFGNKFDDNSDDIVLQCLEDELQIRQIQEFHCRS